MTVSSTKFSIEHIGNGSVVSFPYDFRILEASHLKVYIDYAELTTGFTITGVDNQNGGEVIFNIAPAIGSKILLERDVPATQEVDYQAYDAFPAETHERALDKAMMVAQQAFDGRSVRLPKPIKPNDFNPVLPTDIAQAGRFPVVNKAGDGFEMSPLSIDGIVQAANNAATSAFNAAASAVSAQKFANDAQTFANDAQSSADEAAQFAQAAEDSATRVDLGALDQAVADSQQAAQEALSFSQAAEDSANAAADSEMAAQQAADISASSALVYPDVSAAEGLSVSGVSITAAGTGGIDGTYPINILNDTGKGAKGYYVVSGGQIVSAEITSRGYGYTGTGVVLLTNPVGGGLSLSFEDTVVDGDYFWVVSAEDSEVLELWLMGVSSATDTGKRTASSIMVYEAQQAAESAKEDRQAAADSAQTAGEQAGIATGAASTATAAKDYLESYLFHYIEDDDTSVTVGIGTQVLVSESTSGYPSVLLELSIP